MLKNDITSCDEDQLDATVGSRDTMLRNRLFLKVAREETKKSEYEAGLVRMTRRAKKMNPSERMTYAHKKAEKKRPIHAGGREAAGWRDEVHHSRTVVPRTLYAAELDVAVPFYSLNTLNAVAAFQAITFKVNSLADATIIYLGLADFNIIYTRYRVIGLKGKLTFVNRHATSSIICTHVITNTATAAAAFADVYKFGLNPGGKDSFLGLSSGGHDKCIHHMKTSIAALEGTQEVETADSYAAVTSAVADPANLLYLQAQVGSGGGGAITFAGELIWQGTLRVRYFEPKRQ